MHVEHDVLGLLSGSLVEVIYRRCGVIAERPGGDDTIRRPAAWTMHDDAWTGGGDARQQLCATSFSSNAAYFDVAPAALADGFALKAEAKVVL